MVHFSDVFVIGGVVVLMWVLVVVFLVVGYLEIEESWDSMGSELIEKDTYSWVV